ncbi:uncharacterized protein LOC141686266 [Apium graveolens]|uniref:uncharacterized protein LOC141686266 n=1 Tax=Apium graveolens TaxID=4045 RepID=UPI003D7A5BCB
MIKRVMQSNRCPWRWSAAETDNHVLFNCDFARTVWNMAGLQQVVQTEMHNTSFEVFLRVFEVCTREKCVQIGMLAWAIWNRRNKWVWEHINGSTYGVKAMATSYLTEWKSAQVKRVGVGDQFWRKPMAGWIKINTNATVFPDGSVGVRCVLRDEQSFFLGARNNKIVGAWSPREAETLGMKEALS